MNLFAFLMINFSVILVGCTMPIQTGATYGAPGGTTVGSYTSSSPSVKLDGLAVGVGPYASASAHGRGTSGGGHQPTSSHRRWYSPATTPASDSTSPPTAAEDLGIRTAP